MFCNVLGYFDREYGSMDIIKQGSLVSEHPKVR